MAYFQIKYLGQSGGIETMTVEAETKEQAISVSGIPAQIVNSVSVDHLGGLKSALLDKKFPLVEQALILSAIASKLQSGKTFAKAVVESVSYEKLGITMQQIEACQTPKDYLVLFRFDETAVLLAEAGDKAGRLSESLTRAANAINEREAARKEFGKAMSQGLLYSGLGLAFMVGIPLWAGSTLIEFIEVQRVPLKLNSFSKVIMFLHMVYTQLTLPMLGCFSVVYFFRDKIWEAIRRWPLMNFINERIKIRRGLDFVQTYQLLLSSGYTNPQCFRFLHQRSKGMTHMLYSEALERLQEGRELSEIFKSEEWPPILYQNLQGFDMQSPAGRETVLANLANALKAYFLQYSGKVSQLALMFGFGMILVTIMLFAVGFYMPIINLNAALK